MIDEDLREGKVIISKFLTHHFVSVVLIIIISSSFGRMKEVNEPFDEFHKALQKSAAS